MEIRVKAYSKDFINNEKMLIKDGVAYLFDDNHLSYLEGLEDIGVRHEIILNDDEVILKRSGDFQSVTSLKLNEYRESVVKSIYGDLRFDSFLKKCEKSDDKWCIEYMLFNGEDLITHVEIVWELSGVSN